MQFYALIFLNSYSFCINVLSKCLSEFFSDGIYFDLSTQQKKRTAMIYYGSLAHKLLIIFINL